MISFLLEEGVLTVGVLSGIFTTGLLNSLKANIIDPGIENIFPSHMLDTQSQSKFSDMFPLPTGKHEPPTPSTKHIIKWQTFLKDFITWLIIMYCLYLIWKNDLQPIKNSKK
jgi:large-conductance mechanosensitive channel